MAVRILLISMMLAVAGSAGYYFLFVNAERSCAVCHRPLHPETFYRIHLKGGESEDVCCPRCGLRFQRDRKDVASTEVADFFHGRRLDAQKAFYVEGSSVHLCCGEPAPRRDATGGQFVLTWDRCLPSLVAFATREEAEGFRRQHGGTVKTYADLLKEEP